MLLPRIRQRIVGEPDGFDAAAGKNAVIGINRCIDQSDANFACANSRSFLLRRPAYDGTREANRPCRSAGWGSAPADSSD